MHNLYKLNKMDKQTKKLKYGSEKEQKLYDTILKAHKSLKIKGIIK